MFLKKRNNEWFVKRLKRVSLCFRQSPTMWLVKQHQRTLLSILVNFLFPQASNCTYDVRKNIGDCTSQ